MYFGELCRLIGCREIESGTRLALLAWALMSPSSVGSEGGAQLLVRGTEMVQVSSPVQPGYRAPDHGVWTGTFSALEREV